ncbi:Rossmann fold nucleotide-binding protein Smf [Stenotrophomonas maltophilia]|nr:Rossmann fold nucleotide-binding protein Smf [Stenotrophomonas maltophilia]
MLRGVGPSALKKVSASPNFLKYSAEDLARELPAASKALQDPDAWLRAVEDAQRQIEEAGRYESRILSPLDAEYPSLLSATKDDPFLIFVRGRLSDTPRRSVAVIGTRQPTQHGVLIAQRISQFFVGNGWSVVSGLALGCDAIAHQAALDAGGHTIAVLAHGLHTVSPARHRKLADEILEGGGALISEYRFGQDPLPQQFVKRDRTQAGLSQGVIMVQSDLKGGSLYASRASLSYGRWLAVPYPTALDFANGEPKIQANLVISDGSDKQKEEILACSPSDLGRVIVLRGRGDYPSLIRHRVD